MQSYETPWPSGFSEGDELCTFHCAQGYSFMLIFSFQTHAYFLIGLNSDHCPRHCVILNNFYWLFWQLPLEKRLIALGRLGVRSNKVKFWDLSFSRLPKVQKGRFLSILHWENSLSHLKWLPNCSFLLWWWAVGFAKTPAPGMRKMKTSKLKCNKNHYFAQK